jgi:CheY-like chemotaxis protein
MTANSGKAALEALAAKPFGLVFTDLWMPAMDGGELTRRIRQVPSWRGLPVIAVTADTEATDHFSLEDFTAVMNKPVSLPQMSSLVEKYCAVRSSTPA